MGKPRPWEDYCKHCNSIAIPMDSVGSPAGERQLRPSLSSSPHRKRCGPGYGLAVTPVGVGALSFWFHDFCVLSDLKQKEHPTFLLVHSWGKTLTIAKGFLRKTPNDRFRVPAPVTRGTSWSLRARCVAPRGVLRSVRNLRTHWCANRRPKWTEMGTVPFQLQSNIFR